MSKFDIFFITFEIVYAFIQYYNSKYDKANFSLLLVVVFILFKIFQKLK